MEENIIKFNGANKEGNTAEMTNFKEVTKKIYLKFLELLKLESETTQVAFR